MDWFLYDNGLRHERVKQSDLSKMQKINGDFFQQFLGQNLCWFLF